MNDTGQPTELFRELDKNTAYFKQLLHEPKDLIIKVFSSAGTGIRCCLMYMDGLTDTTIINDNIIRPLSQAVASGGADSRFAAGARREFLTVVKELVVQSGKVQEATGLEEVSHALLAGDTVIMLDELDCALLIGSKSPPLRAIQEPVTEAVVRGPRDGFTESIRTNMALVRSRLRDPNLRMHTCSVGRRSRSSLTILHVDGIAHPNIVAEVKRRLDTIDVDALPESGIIEQWIEDSFMSPFPQVLHTERVDKVVSALVQGKVAIMLEGTPFVLVAPVTFSQLLNSPEDYYERWMVGSLIRILRYGAAFIAVFLPAFYIALVSYHPGLIPSKLAFSIAATREGVPFPAIVEVFMMEATMELLREAGIRLPKPIGQTIGIVGGLVIGEAAVSAGVVSPIMVIVVALTAISSFAIPSYSISLSFRLLRFVVMLGASIFGFFGIVLVYIMINIHVANLKSFGIPYSTPFAPFFRKDWSDLVWRSPTMMLGDRPAFLKTMDKQRYREKGE